MDLVCDWNTMMKEVNVAVTKGIQGWTVAMGGRAKYGGSAVIAVTI